jgi:hypothetical protein
VVLLFSVWEAFSDGKTLAIIGAHLTIRNVRATKICLAIAIHSRTAEHALVRVTTILPHAKHRWFKANTVIAAVQHYLAPLPGPAFFTDISLIIHAYSIHAGP